jgi:hypothetical protein
MRDLDLFQQALGLDEPWRVVATYFDPDAGTLTYSGETSGATLRRAALVITPSTPWWTRSWWRSTP